MLLDLYFHHQEEIEDRFRGTRVPPIFTPIRDAEVQVYATHAVVKTTTSVKCFGSAVSKSSSHRAGAWAVTTTRSRANAFVRTKKLTAVCGYSTAASHADASAPSVSVSVPSRSVGAKAGGGAVAVARMIVSSCAGSGARSLGVCNPSDEEMMLMARAVVKTRLTRSKNYDYNAL